MTVTETTVIIIIIIIIVIFVLILYCNGQEYFTTLSPLQTFRPHTSPTTSAKQLQYFPPTRHPAHCGCSRRKRIIRVWDCHLERTTASGLARAIRNAYIGICGCDRHCVPLLYYIIISALCIYYIVMVFQRTKYFPSKHSHIRTI
jgi:hypothetical protein